MIGLAALAAFSASAQHATSRTGAAPRVEPAPLAPAAPGSERDRVTITGMVPIPKVGEGAAYYTPKELDAVAKEAGRNFAEATTNALKCKDVKPGVPAPPPPMYRATLERVFRNEMEASNRVSGAAKRAADATAAAEQSRRDAAEGKVEMKVVEAAELERQEAVNKLVEARDKLAEARDNTATVQDLYLKAAFAEERKKAKLESQITWGELDFIAIQRRQSAQKVDPDFRKLAITDIVTERKSDRKGEFLHITGVIRNTADSTARIPALRVAALDAAGWTIKAEVADQSGGQRIRQGEAFGFVYDMRPAPDATDTVLVVFASDALPPPRMQVNQFDQCRTE